MINEWDDVHIVSTDEENVWWTHADPVTIEASK